MHPLCIHYFLILLSPGHISPSSLFPSANFVLHRFCIHALICGRERRRPCRWRRWRGAPPSNQRHFPSGTLANCIWSMISSFRLWFHSRLSAASRILHVLQAIAGRIRQWWFWRSSLPDRCSRVAVWVACPACTPLSPDTSWSSPDRHRPSPTASPNTVSQLFGSSSARLASASGTRSANTDSAWPVSLVIAASSSESALLCFLSAVHLVLSLLLGVRRPPLLLLLPPLLLLLPPPILLLPPQHYLHTPQLHLEDWRTRIGTDRSLCSALRRGADLHWAQCSSLLGAFAEAADSLSGTSFLHWWVWTHPWTCDRCLLGFPRVLPNPHCKQATPAPLTLAWSSVDSAWRASSACTSCLVAWVSSLTCLSLSIPSLSSMFDLAICLRSRLRSLSSTSQRQSDPDLAPSFASCLTSLASPPISPWRSS